VVSLIASEPQHIVVGSGSRNVQSENVGCGYKLQPWSIEALAGQQITVSIIHFGKTFFKIYFMLISLGYLVYQTLFFKVDLN